MSRKRGYQSSSIQLSEDADHVYYNLSLNNPTSSDKLAVFSENRSTAILDNPSDYTLSVIRFSLSKINIPIFFMNVFPKYTNNPLPWNITDTFIQDQGVRYNGLVYKSLIGNNFGLQPDINPTAWRLVAQNSVEQWSSSKTYSIDQFANYGNSVYVSLVNGNLNNNPTTSPVQWGLTQTLPVLNNICPNRSRYSVSMSYLGSSVTESIIYEPVATNTVTRVPEDWTIVDSSNSAYYGVFMFSQFIDMINRALKACYNRIDPTNASPPKAAGVPAPYLLYDPDTLNISLIAHRLFDENFALADTMKIFFNIDLMSFFKDSLQYDQFNGYGGNAGLDFKLKVGSRGDNDRTLVYPDVLYPKWQDTLNYAINAGVSYNGVNYTSLTVNFNAQPNISPGDWAVQAQKPIPQTYSKTGVYALNQVVEYEGSYYINTTGANTGPPNGIDWNNYSGFDMLIMKGDYSNLYNWVDIQSIVFVSNLVPVVDEFVPAGRLNPNSSIGTLSTSNPTLQIITDFVPEIQTGVDINSNIVYFNQGEYRLSNLVSDTPLRAINVQIYFTDRNNQLFPLYLEPFGFASCKLMFRKKHIKQGF